MTAIKINQLTAEQQFNGFFQHYPMELVEQLLASAFEPHLPPETTDELVSCTQLFYEELNQLIHNCARISNEITIQDTIAVRKHESVKNLKMIIYFLKELLPASHIFCSTLNEKRIDLLIIIDRYGSKPISEIHDLFNFMNFCHPNLNCSVFSYGTIKEILSKGHFYYSAICTPNNCVYQKSTAWELPLLSPGQHTAVSNRAKLVFNENMDKAISFLRGAIDYFGCGKTKMAAFMLQQAFEMSYRSLIITLRGKEIKCHELTVLRKHLGPYAPEIIGALDPVEQNEIQLLTQIQEAYVKSRYDLHYEVYPSVLSQHILAAKQLIQLCQQLFEKQVSKLKTALA